MAAQMQFHQPPWYKMACWTCRDRKIKCDKVLPCRNCSIAGVVCSYPPPVRTVRRPKKAQSHSSVKPDAALVERVAKLEALLKKQSPELHQLDHGDGSGGGSGGGDGVGDGDHGTCVEDSREPGGNDASSPALSKRTTSTMPSMATSLPSEHGADSSSGPMDTTNDPAWRIPPGSGMPPPRPKGIDCEARDSGYWKRMEEECASQVFLKAPSSKKSGSGGSDRELHQMASNNNELPKMTFPFQGASATTTASLPVPVPLLSLKQRLVCWQKYLENVDPILKILHKSTTQTLMLLRDEHCYSLDPQSRALVQAICLLAVTSMTDADVSASFERDKESVMRACASLTEQALMAAQFLEAQDLSTIQALLLFLYYLRCTEDARLNALNGMAIFLAIRAGLNRDGAASSALSYLEVELRRRTWWQLITLVDHPDDSGLDYFPPGTGADTRLPLNVDDCELDLQGARPSEERTGFTDTSFCLMQYEVTRTFNQIKFERARASAGRRFRAEEAEQRLHSSRELFRHKYFQDSPREAAIGEFAADVIAMVLAKRRLLMHISPENRNNNNNSNNGNGNGSGSGEVLPPSAQDHLFLLAVHVLELSRSLQTNKSNEKWRWLSETYFQWSIAAFVVKNLTIRPSSTATRRAWHVIDGILDYWPTATRQSAKASRLRALIAGATRHREAENLWASSLPNWPVGGGGNHNNNNNNNINSIIGCSLPSSIPAHHQKTTTTTTAADARRETQFNWADSLNTLQQPAGAMLPLNQAMVSDSFAAMDFGFDEDLACNVDLGLLSQWGQ